MGRPATRRGIHANRFQEARGQAQNIAMAQQIAAIPKYRALRRQGMMRHSHSACS
jgi:hypothetical protein